MFASEYTKKRRGNSVSPPRFTWYSTYMSGVCVDVTCSYQAFTAAVVAVRRSVRLSGCGGEGR